jgi:hypothetical protein
MPQAAKNKTDVGLICQSLDNLSSAVRDKLSNECLHDGMVGYFSVTDAIARIATAIEKHTTPEDTETAEAIRDAFVSDIEGHAGVNVTDALNEVSRSLDSIAVALDKIANAFMNSE